MPPKRPYSFEKMLADLLQFALSHLVDNGRLSFWMPTANDEDVFLAIPERAGMELVSVCQQPFNKCPGFQSTNLWFNLLTLDSGSRRLLTYRRLPDSSTPLSLDAMVPSNGSKDEAPRTGTTANDLNSFRRRVGLLPSQLLTLRPRTNPQAT